ncbi:MAG: ABC transporter substrate-binding protein [Bacteroidales bacterium]|nr:ABC transporter substrate-binding protein [Bacteroidales bacterium]
MRTFLLFLFCLFLISACKDPGSGNDKNQVYIIATLKGPSSMGMIKMIDSLNSSGNPSMKVEILNEPIQVRRMMLDGTADFAVLPTTMAAILYNKGIGYRVIAIPVWGTFYLFGSDTSITRWVELKGRKIHAMAKGMTPDVMFRYLLIKNGIDPDNDISFDYSFPTHIDLANAIAAGQAELGVIAEPFASLVMTKNKALKPLFYLNDEWNRIEGSPPATTALMVKTGIIKDNPTAIDRVLSAYNYSTNWVNRFPDSAAHLIVKYNIMPEFEVAFDAVQKSALHFEKAANVRLQVNEFLNVFYKMNPDIIGGKIPDEDFCY